MPRYFFGLLLALPLLAQQPDEESLRRARAATQALAVEVRQLLSDALAAQGYAGAVQACSQVAQQKTQAVAAAQGLPVRRISLRYRNAASRPDGWENQQLSHWEKQAERNLPVPDEVYEVLRTNGQSELRYLKPIRLEAVCMGCHGDKQSLAPGVPEKLKVLYPADKATGYHTGQLRGAISVRVPLN